MFRHTFILVLALLLVAILHTSTADGHGRGLVDVDVREHGYGGKHVGVHVPAFYKMDLDKGPYRGTGLGINVLEGLVKVRVKKDPYGLFKPRVHVAVAGMPFWDQ